MSPDGVKLKAGSQVKITGFPRPTDPNNSITYDGQIGVIVKVVDMGVMRGGGGYSYEVEFKDMEMNYSQLDPDTRKLVRGTKVITVRNIFHEGYVELIALPPAPAPLAPQAPAVPSSSIQSDKWEKSEVDKESVDKESAPVPAPGRPEVASVIEEQPQPPATIKLGEAPPKLDPNTDIEALTAKIRADLEEEMRRKK